MNSLFSFLEPSETNEPEPVEETTPSAAASQPTTAFTLAPSLDLPQVLQEMIAHLTGFLPPPIVGVPQPSVIILTLNDAPVGLGNFIGGEPRGPIGLVEVKGGRLDGGVRFMLWGNNMQEVNDAMLVLQADLLAAHQTLLGRGFLKFTAAASSNPQFDAALNAWSRTADYSLLYEYRYEDADAAQSLIARIPIHADSELINSPNRETTTVTDEMARWDDQTAPVLAVRGQATFSRLSVLVFVASALPTGSVTITRTFDGAAGPPAEFPTLAEFLAALADPVAPEHHARVVFATYSDFLAQFSPESAPLHLGDWNLDDIPDEYQGFDLELAPSIRLPKIFDRLEVMYEIGIEPLNQVAVIYLQFRN